VSIVGHTEDWMIPPSNGRPCPDEEHRAAMVAASNATDAEDLRDLLWVLGMWESDRID
jgi:hypothetical protein